MIVTPDIIRNLLRFFRSGVSDVKIEVMNNITFIVSWILSEIGDDLILEIHRVSLPLVHYYNNPVWG